MTNQKLYYAASAVYNYWAGGDPALKDRMEELRTILDSLREAKSEIAIPPDRIHACPKCGGYTSPEAVHKCEGESTDEEIEFIKLSACHCETKPEDETLLNIDPACPVHGAPERKEEGRELREGDETNWMDDIVQSHLDRPAPARQGEVHLPYVAYGPGYSGAFGTREEAENVVSKNTTGAVYKIISRQGEEKHPAMLALENITPGGSEFYEDIPRCVAWIKNRINHNWDMAKKARKEANALEARLTRALDVVRQCAEAIDKEYHGDGSEEDGCTCALCVARVACREVLGEEKK